MRMECSLAAALMVVRSRRKCSPFSVICTEREGVEMWCFFWLAGCSDSRIVPQICSCDIEI